MYFLDDNISYNYDMSLIQLAKIFNDLNNWIDYRVNVQNILHNIPMLLEQAMKPTQGVVGIIGNN